ATNYQEPRVGHIAIDAGRCFEKFWLALPTREVVSAYDRENIMMRLQPPRFALARGETRTKAVHVEATINDMDFLVIAQDGRTKVAFGVFRPGFRIAIAEDFCDEMRNGYHRVTLPQQESPAQRRRRALGKVPTKDDLWVNARTPGCADGR